MPWFIQGKSCKLHFFSSEKLSITFFWPKTDGLSKRKVVNYFFVAEIRLLIQGKRCNLLFFQVKSCQLLFFWPRTDVLFKGKVVSYLPSDQGPRCGLTQQERRLKRFKGKVVSHLPSDQGPHCSLRNRNNSCSLQPAWVDQIRSHVTCHLIRVHTQWRS